MSKQASFSSIFFPGGTDGRTGTDPHHDLTRRGCFPMDEGGEISACRHIGVTSWPSFMKLPVLHAAYHSYLLALTALVSAIGRGRYICGAGGSRGERGRGGEIEFRNGRGTEAGRAGGQEGRRARPGPVVVFTGSVWRGGAWVPALEVLGRWAPGLGFLLFVSRSAPLSVCRPAVPPPPELDLSLDEEGLRLLRLSVSQSARLRPGLVVRVFCIFPDRD